MNKSLYIEIITKAGNLRNDNKIENITNTNDFQVISKNIDNMIAFNALVESFAYDTGLDLVRLGDAIIHPANLIHFKRLHELSIKIRKGHTADDILRIYNEEELKELYQYSIAIEAGALGKEHLILRRINGNRDLYKVFCRYGELCTALKSLVEDDDFESDMDTVIVLDNLITQYLITNYGYDIDDVIPGNWLCNDLISNMRKMANLKYDQITRYFRQEINDTEFTLFVNIATRLINCVKKIQSSDKLAILREYIVEFVSSDMYIDRCHERLEAIKIITDSIYDKHFKDLIINQGCCSIIGNMGILNNTRNEIDYNQFHDHYNNIKYLEVGTAWDDSVLVDEANTKKVIDGLVYCHLDNETLTKAETCHAMNFVKNAELIELTWKVFKLFNEDYLHDAEQNIPEFNELICRYKDEIPMDFSIIQFLNDSLIKTMEKFVDEFCKLGIDPDKTDKDDNHKCDCENTAAVVERLCEGFQALSNQFVCKSREYVRDILLVAVPNCIEFKIDTIGECSIYDFSKIVVNAIFSNNTDMKKTIKGITDITYRIIDVLHDDEVIRAISKMRASLIDIRDTLKHNVEERLLPAGPHDRFSIAYYRAIELFDKTTIYPFGMMPNDIGTSNIVSNYIGTLLTDNIDISIQNSSIYKMLFHLDYDLGLAKATMITMSKHIAKLDELIVENVSIIYNESMNYLAKLKKGK